MWSEMVPGRLGAAGLPLGEEALIEEIRAKVAAGAFEYSRHAVDQSILRSISILGFTQRGRVLHVQCSHPSRPLLKIVTVYEPDPALWMNYRVRKG